MNEAALAAARKNRSTIGWEEVDSSVDRITVGLEKKTGSSLMKQRDLVAYHEAGHAIVGAVVPDYDQVSKISIVPRSNGAGGLTFFSPQESRLDSGMYTKQYLESQLAVALGGRIAEEIVYGETDVTTGAVNDFERVMDVASRMVKEFGMSEKIGPLCLKDFSSNGPFMGRMMLGRQSQWGDEIMGVVEEEVERLVNNSYLIAKKVLTENRALLDHVAQTLLDQENVTAEEFQMMLVEYKVKAIDYAIIGEEVNRESLPYRKFLEAAKPAIAA
jgi:cell division protease FtsH